MNCCFVRAFISFINLKSAAMHHFSSGFCLGLCSVVTAQMETWRRGE